MERNILFQHEVILIVDEFLFAVSEGKNIKNGSDKRSCAWYLVEIQD